MARRLMRRKHGTVLKAPYQYFGGKSRVAGLIWESFGRVVNYVEPFFGSGAVLLARPRPFTGSETVNDLYAQLSNFWRAVANDPDGVAKHADWPVSELDLHARGDWLFYRKGVRKWTEKLRSNTDFYDVKAAGWWVWGMSACIGNTYMPQSGPDRADNVVRNTPNLGGSEGVHRQLARTIPILTSKQGIHRIQRSMPKVGGGRNRTGIQRKQLQRSIPELDHARGMLCQLPAAGEPTPDDPPFVTERTYQLREYMRQLCERMREVRICCGDWSRVMSPSATWKHGITGVFLDPPYSFSDRNKVYGDTDQLDVAGDVRKWCLENGANKLLRIALCGYESEHNELEENGWRKVAWKAQGGMANRSGDNVNARRERIWFSPHCVHGMLLPF